MAPLTRLEQLEQARAQKQEADEARLADARQRAEKLTEPVRLTRVRLLRDWVDGRGNGYLACHQLMVPEGQAEDLIRNGTAERVLTEDEMLINLLKLRDAGLLTTPGTHQKLIDMARKGGVPVQEAKGKDKSRSQSDRKA